MLNGGSIGDAFKAGVIGAVVGGVTGGVTHGIGSHFDSLGGTFEGEFGRAFAHGVVGGAVSEATGGEFRHGFFGSFAGSAAGSLAPKMGLPAYTDRSPGAIAARTCFAAAVGGTASALGGGKFANGAVTSAFQHLFNSETQRMREVPSTRTYVIAHAFTDESVGDLVKFLKDNGVALRNRDFESIKDALETNYELLNKYVIENRADFMIKHETTQETVTNIPQDWTRGKVDVTATAPSARVRMELHHVDLLAPHRGLQYGPGEKSWHTITNIPRPTALVISATEIQRFTYEPPKK